MNQGMSATPNKSPELTRVREESDAALKILAETVNQLTARLSIVMRPEPSVAESEKARDPKYYSKLAQDIDLHNNSIWSVTYLVKSIIDRLEI